jgi:hypothetical protein
MSADFGGGTQGPTTPPPGGPYFGGAAPPPPSGPPGPSGLGAGWSPQPAPVRLPSLPRGIDLSVIVIGLGALLTFVGFLCGAGAAGQYGPGGTESAYRGWLEAFFVLAGFGILVMVGGWLFRVVTIARRPRY